jgi:hypothetical protein
VVQIETSQRTGRDPDNLHKKHRSGVQSDGKKVSRFRQEMKKRPIIYAIMPVRALP